LPELLELVTGMGDVFVVQFLKLPEVLLHLPEPVPTELDNVQSFM